MVHLWSDSSLSSPAAPHRSQTQVSSRPPVLSLPRAQLALPIPQPLPRGQATLPSPIQQGWPRAPPPRPLLLTMLGQ